MRLAAHEADLFLTDCTTRMPFRFGVSTLTFAPLATLRVRATTESGERVDGFSSDLLVPKWFEKDPAKTAQQDVAELILSIDLARACVVEAPRVATVFDHWLALREVLAGDPRPALVTGLGVSMVERALIDAACRAANVSFFAALKGDLLGTDPALNAGLPERPAQSIHVRHTVGLLDALRDQDIPAERRVNDGLPESLEADIRRYGLRYFKIKLCGDRERDLERLAAIGRVVEATVGDDARYTIDGNEQFEDLGDLADLFDAFAATETGARMLRGLLFVEQPLARTCTFDAEANAAMPRVNAYAPVIIDEADEDLASFPVSTLQGYGGVSIKNCKGVFRALSNHKLCRMSPDPLFQSAEDLTNLPVVALQQDLATVAALGVDHVERNGHHYFRGLDHLPRREAEDALATHGDLYERRDDGGVALRIGGGRLSLGSLNVPGYGYGITIDCDGRIPAAEWRWPEPAGDATR